MTIQQLSNRRRKMSAPIQLNRYLTEREVAKMTGRSRSSLQKDRYNREGIPFVKINRSVRYTLRDVMDFMDDHKVETSKAG